MKKSEKIEQQLSKLSDELAVLYEKPNPTNADRAEMDRLNKELDRVYARFTNAVEDEQMRVASKE